MLATLTINKIVFSAGRDPSDSPLVLDPSEVTVLVGPNNSGKSLALREIESACRAENRTHKVISDVDANWPADAAEGLTLIRAFESETPPGSVTAPGQFWVKSPQFHKQSHIHQTQIQLEHLMGVLTRRDIRALFAYFGPLYTVRLDGRTRFALTDPKPSGDLQRKPENHLWALMVDAAARAEVRRLTEEAFSGLYFLVDATGIQTFRIRLSNRPPFDEAEEQAFDQRAREFHNAATLIEDFSDGVRAFVGLISALLGLPHRIILIDEPEAFLHPPLARRLGYDMATLARNRGASLLTATHSAEFLFGCLEATTALNVVRLTYEGGAATARALSSSDLTMMATDPLLRSTGMLRALFHRAAIISESDMDRAFYDEINRRLAAEDRGITDALFLNAQGKDSIHRMIKPLRHIGIPAVAIVDLDLVVADVTFGNTLDACQVPVSEHPRLEADRNWLAGRFDALPTLPDGAKQIKRKGLNALAVADRPRAEAFLMELQRYGLFLLPGGEVESWLRSLGVDGHGPKWLVSIFKRIGRSESESYYLRPGSDDVWEFLDSAAAWVANPARLGTE